MTDRIVLTNLRFQSRHGVHAYERAQPQPFEVDVELELDLRPAGVGDDLSKTIDYGDVYQFVAAVMEGTSYRLLEAIAEAIGHGVLVRYPVDAVVVRIRKPAVRLGGPVDHASVEIRREREGS